MIGQHSAWVFGIRLVGGAALTTWCAFALVNCSSPGAAPNQPDETSYTTMLTSINATQVARNAVVYRGTVVDPDPETLFRFLREFIAALEPYRLDLQRLDPPDDVVSRHTAMVRATENLISNSRALLDEDEASGESESTLRLLEAQGKAYLAFGSACRELTPTDFDCGALFERRTSKSQ